MTHVAQMRSLDFFDPSSSTTPVDLIGLGGIGSFTGLALARLGVGRIGIYDDDTVDEHNIGCQAYDWSDLHKPKADVMRERIEIINPNIELSANQRTISNRSELDHGASVVVTAVDNMASRASIFDTCYLNMHTPFYVDARLAGQLIHVHGFDPTNIAHADKYKSSLHDDSEAEPASCTAQNIIDVGYQVASLIVRLVRAHLAPNDNPPANFISLNQQSLHLTALSYDNPDLTFS